MNNSPVIGVVILLLLVFGFVNAVIGAALIAGPGPAFVVAAVLMLAAAAVLMRGRVGE
jgi:hypothetical protein